MQERLKALWTDYHATITHVLAAVIALVGGALAHRYGFNPVIVEKVVEVVVQADPPPAPGGDAPVRAMGWYDDPEAVQAVARQLRFPVFALTPAGLAGDELPDHAYLWDASMAALGRHVPTRDQGQVGSCVSFGAACAAEYCQCVAMVRANKAGQPPPQFKDLSQEVIYGGSRVQIGGGRLRGQDGSVGAWAAQWCTQDGVVARGVYGSYDLSTYSESTCRKFGDAGCPAELIAIAKQTPVKSVSAVTTTDELRQALSNGYPVTVASNVGFGNRGPYVRDSNGFLRASGSWGHQMCFIGYSPSGFYVMNSWGEKWVSGPSGPGNPPPGGFWVTPATAQKMLAANDSWAYADIQGFPSRKLDWLIDWRKPDRKPFEHAATPIAESKFSSQRPSLLAW